LFDVPQANQLTGAVSGLGLFKGAVFVGSREFIKLLAETAGTAIFAFGVSAVMFGKVSEQVKGAVVAVSLFLGSLVAVLLGSFDAATLATRGLLNPAVALGLGFPGSLSLAYIVGPIIGAVIGANLYRLLAVEESGQEKISI
jgi:glycerol uptake facilitator-like aquaporin